MVLFFVFFYIFFFSFSIYVFFYNCYHNFLTSVGLEFVALFDWVVALVLAGLSRQHELPGRGEEQLYPSDRGPLHQGATQPVAPEGGAQAGAVRLPGYVQGVKGRVGSY